MRLPYTPSNLALWLDPQEKQVYKDSNNKVYSVLNKVNGKPIVQANPAAQPTWSETSFNGVPGLTFSGSQYLNCNDIAAICAGNKTPLTIVQAVLQPAIATAMPFTMSVGNLSAFALYEVAFTNAFTGNDFFITYSDDAHQVGGPQVVYSSPSVTNTPFVYTATYGNNSISLRINGVDIGNAVNTKGQLTCDTCTIGGFINANGFQFGLNGVMGPTLLFLGTNGVIEAEKAMLKHCRISG